MNGSELTQLMRAGNVIMISSGYVQLTFILCTFILYRVYFSNDHVCSNSNLIPLQVVSDFGQRFWVQIAFS